jgi:hypothetical protein
MNYDHHTHKCTECYERSTCEMDCSVEFDKETDPPRGGHIVCRKCNETKTASAAPKVTSPNLVKWLAGGSRGASSNAIVQHLTGLPAAKSDPRFHPLDPWDLRRCLLLLELCPELKPDLHKMKEVSPQWSALIDIWEELEKLFEEEVPDWREKENLNPRVPWRAPKTNARMEPIAWPPRHR